VLQQRHDSKKTKPSFSVAMQRDVQSTVIYYQKTRMNLQCRSSEQNPETAGNAYPIYIWVNEEFK
jgi:hypothetical protein